MERATRSVADGDQDDPQALLIDTVMESVSEPDPSANHREAVEVYWESLEG